MLEKTKLILKHSAARLRSVIADSQYSDGKLGSAVCEAVIPYPANQKHGVTGLLRVDKKFRTYGPTLALTWQLKAVFGTTLTVFVNKNSIFRE